MINTKSLKWIIRFKCLLLIFNLSCIKEDPEPEFSSYCSSQDLNRQSLKAPNLFFETQDPYYLNRKWQGLPSMDIDKDDVLWSTWYSGGINEGVENYVTVSYSEDKGNTWNKNFIIIDPGAEVRAFDPCIWYNKKDKSIYVFWNQSFGFWDGTGGVWYIRSSDPQNKNSWSTPRRICDGVLINKPEKTFEGDFLLPVSLWGNLYPNVEYFTKPLECNLYKVGINLYRTDDFRNVVLEKVISIPYSIKDVDEPTIVRTKITEYLILFRTKQGVYTTTYNSADLSHTPIEPFPISPNTVSKVQIKKLKSGNILLVMNYSKNREKMAALISKDKGKSWSYQYVFDSRFGLSYPCISEDSEDNIYVVYDRNRSSNMEINMARFKEIDIKTNNLMNIIIKTISYNGNF